MEIQYKHTLQYVLLIICVLGLYACANQQAPTGGPVDEIPPQLVQDKSSPNYQTNFQDREFSLTFEEFVKLDNPRNNILVSPIIEKPLITILRGKKLIVRIPEEVKLSENTTYIIQFGETVKDLSRGNPNTALKFVFSTGPVIDSLQLEVHLSIPDKPKKPLDGIMVGLYNNLSDTVLRKAKPYYYARTDTSGIARLTNIKAGNYALYALDDQNSNYQFDQLEEGYSFYTDTIRLPENHRQTIDLTLLNDLISPKNKERFKLSENLYVLTFDGGLDYLSWKTNDSLEITKHFIKKDSLFLWTNSTAKNNKIIFDSDYAEPDTISLTGLEVSSTYTNQALILGRISSKKSLKKLYINLDFNWPIKSVDLSKIKLIDTAGLIIIEDKLSWSAPITSHNIQVMSETDLIVDSVFIDSLAILTEDNLSIKSEFKLRTKAAKLLSNLTVNVEQLDSTQQYIIELRDATDKLFAKKTIVNQSKNRWFIPGLSPKKYKLVLIHDQNKNNFWDGAFFDYRQHSESKITTDVTSLRANWDVESNISFPIK